MVHFPAFVLKNDFGCIVFVFISSWFSSLSLSPFQVLSCSISYFIILKNFFIVCVLNNKSVFVN